jgi:hypothetical protein
MSAKLDITALVDAAVWLLHLDPNAGAPSAQMGDVADRLLADPTQAVKALVKGRAWNTLRIRLGPYRRDVLHPDSEAIYAAVVWAEEHGLPTVPLERLAPFADAIFVPADRLRPTERDALILARAVSDRVDTLSPEAQDAYRRLLRMAEARGCHNLID